jgi:hypothetical protein
MSSKGKSAEVTIKDDKDNPVGKEVSKEKNKGSFKIELRKIGYLEENISATFDYVCPPICPT